jgi:Homeodomain-like domain
VSLTDVRKIEQISISAADRERLEGLGPRQKTPQKVVWRARVVLSTSDGLTAVAIAAAVGKSVLTVRRWRRRYMAKGVDGAGEVLEKVARAKQALDSQHLSPLGSPEWQQLGQAYQLR